MEMQEKKLKRFNVYAVIAKVLFIITAFIGSIALVVSIIGEGILIARGTEIIERIQQFITNRGYNFTLPFSEVPHLTVISALILMLSGIALTAFIFISISRMFRSIVNNKTPFQSENVKRIKSMGIGLFIFAGIQLILSTMMSYGITNVINRLSFANIVNGTNFSDHASINWTVIGFGILLLALAEMFEYGANLQQDSSMIV